MLIYLSKADWARQIVMNWNFAFRVASRFVAGETLEDAIRVVKELNSRGINATLDHLGEHTVTQAESERATQDILRMLDLIDKSGIKSNISIKLTQIGLALGEDICEKNLVLILSKAQEQRNFVRIDMEDSSFVEKTIALYENLRQKHGFNNTGIVIQSYLYRSENDISRLRILNARVRLCKGAYKEPPDIAFPRKHDVDAAYDRLAACLVDTAIAANSPELSGDGKIPPIPAIASHDPERLAFIKNYCSQKGLTPRAIEFQMLYGIRRDLQEETVKEGFPVRVYVPFGSHWYPYFIRRLAERPANLWFFVTNFFRN